MLIFRACSKNLFFCRPENLTGMRKSKRSGCPFFSPIFFGQAKKMGSPFGRNQSINARHSRSKMGSPFGRNQNINARQSRNTIESPFGQNPNLPQENKIALLTKPKYQCKAQPQKNEVDL
ncbi:hypothetical protein [Gallibacterium anatis]|uniref:hypothetical protein n=1 Tax=Gallibacterium anatis TaxID=750 RepID=UPI001E3C5D6E|nr:hypothetical protein [Gallibacterium anatis]